MKQSLICKMNFSVFYNSNIFEASTTWLNVCGKKHNIKQLKMILNVIFT